MKYFITVLQFWFKILLREKKYPYRENPFFLPLFCPFFLCAPQPGRGWERRGGREGRAAGPGAWIHVVCKVSTHCSAAARDASFKAQPRAGAKLTNFPQPSFARGRAVAGAGAAGNRAGPMRQWGACVPWRCVWCSMQARATSWLPHSARWCFSSAARTHSTAPRAAAA